MASVEFARKRPREELFSSNVSPTPCSPHKAQFLSHQPAAKRARQTSDGVLPIAGYKRYRDSVFPAHDWEQVSEETSQMYTNKRRKTKCSNPDCQARKFTKEEVADIVCKALKEKEDELREEYSILLSKRLQEQYESFARYNEDCISRQMRDSDYSMSYLS
mmetsp:Transcript_23859/g.66819  ORF Transcript_23859/g.66819 Transcript_23859/m.66819 type:complete len:161 (+) Transcript_23859:30-512(+)|eukprot:CAMPEP_0119120908 /NCGR_PEP_ID=MMETSP1310-20130426/1762_1 /TAXON_ID=464262 /ORGANISM="Genus nov. species nov., Strain RCC2339" /LENGTH=160 /DNA_ID=CAMNT_0007110425 /DNA_START=27 /DNA_END=509 /DNA_ORIENTATION=-